MVTSSKRIAFASAADPKALPSGGDRQAHGCARHGCDAFATSSESQALRGRRLDRNPVEGDAKNLGELRANCIAMRPDLRRLANHCRVNMRDKAAACTNPFGCVTQENVRSRALPLGIRRWKVCANIAVRYRAVERVGDRVHKHIRIGMPVERLGVRDANPAQPNVIAGAEGMDIEALTQPNIGTLVKHPGFGAIEVRHGGHFHISEIACKNVNFVARPFRNSRVIGEVCDIRSRRPEMRRKDNLKVERLRRLHRPQGGAIKSFDHSSASVDLHNCIKNSHTGCRSAPQIGGLNGALN